MISFKQFCEGAKEDSEIRELANSLFDSILKTIKNDADMKRVSRYVGNLRININLSKIKEFKAFKKDKLILWLAKEDDKSNIGGTFGPSFDGKDKVLMLRIFPSYIDLEKQSKQSIVKFLKSSKNRFLHEFVHFLDSRRYKGTDGITGFLKTAKTVSDKEFDDENLDDYYNNPIEYNAYAQQLLQGIGEYIDDTSPKDRLSHVLDGGQSLKHRWFKVLANGDPIVKRWNQKFRKKFFKRYVGFIDDKLDKWKKELNL